MRRLAASDLLPERAGQPVKAWVHISLADLMVLDGDSALQAQWTAQVHCACKAESPSSTIRSASEMCTHAFTGCRPAPAARPTAAHAVAVFLRHA